MKNTLLKSFIFLPMMIFGQANPEKIINQQMQTWTSINTNTKFSEHWGILADGHIRWNGFFDSNNFYLLRGAINYNINPKVAVAGGYAHLWSAPSKPEYNTYADENRLFEQIQWNSQLGKVNVVQRIRNEQRWQENVVNDVVQDYFKFTDRVRYLFSFNIPVFKNKDLPQLVLSNELMLQFGQDVVYNTFEQNRVFIGIKKSLTPSLSFDLGYMNVYQQKSSGYQYDMNHTLRLFFYLNSDLKKK